MNKYVLTRWRIDRGCLNRDLWNKYIELRRAQKAVEGIKEDHPDQYYEIVREQVKDAQRAN